MKLLDFGLRFRRDKKIWMRGLAAAALFLTKIYALLLIKRRKGNEEKSEMHLSAEQMLKKVRKQRLS